MQQKNSLIKSKSVDQKMKQNREEEREKEGKRDQRKQSNWFTTNERDAM